MPSVQDRLLVRIRYDGTGCWVREGARAGNGYSVLSVNGRQQYAHRIAYELFIGPVPLGYEVCHTCDNPPCINPEHLFAGTKSDNMQDAIEKGRFSMGEAHRRPCAKLDGSTVRRIRESNLSNRAAAKAFGVTNSTISKIRTRYLWAHVV